MPHRGSYPDGAVPPVYLFGAAGASGITGSAAVGLFLFLFYQHNDQCGQSGSDNYRSCRNRRRKNPFPVLRAGISAGFAGSGGILRFRAARGIGFTLPDNGVFVPLLSADGALLVTDTVLGVRCGFVCLPDKAVLFPVQILGAVLVAAGVPVVILIEIPLPVSASWL